MRQSWDETAENQEAILAFVRREKAMAAERRDGGPWRLGLCAVLLTLATAVVVWWFLR